MNKKLWITDGLLFIVFFISFIWTSFSRLIFYLKYGSLYLALALLAYLLLNLVYTRLLKKTSNDRQIVTLGILRTVSIGVFLIALSVLEVSYIKEHDTYEETYCRYYDDYGNLIYNSQFGNGCPEVEIIDQDNKNLIVTFSETRTGYFETYHSNITARSYTDINMTFDLKTEININYFSSRIRSVDILYSRVSYSLDNEDIIFNTRGTTHINYEYLYYENSMVIDSIRGNVDSGNEMDDDIEMYHMTIPEENYYPVKEYAYRTFEDGYEEVKTYSSINNGASMITSTTKVYEEDNGLILYTTHHQDDDARTKTEISDDTITHSESNYVGTNADGSLRFDYVGTRYDMGEFRYMKTEEIYIENHIRNTFGNSYIPTMRYRYIYDPNPQNQIIYSQSEPNIAVKFSETEFGFKYAIYQKGEIEENVSILGYGSNPGISWIYSHNHKMFNGEIDDGYIYSKNPFFIFYYGDYYNFD
ncbi:hypothetical protein KQ51_00136 [Candidatus Izimaplasma bacterium HR1]|jgi:hypothetical protein|uniref:hypothetical protein n=1 Tax=Candidatus Izimoplasma sp. HR1 TaxID=1541959 RepID=UPI0004F78365|nr:hypothetical protein KQ51_00136 [Candidatus Izimaplasma bacterium HR1]